MKTRNFSQTQESLKNASSALGIASDLAPLIPVPVLSSIFVTAKGIVDISIKMRQDKRDSAELADYTANLTTIVHKTIRGNENKINKDLSLSLNQLNSVLMEIKEFMSRQVALNFWERLFSRSEVSQSLSDYRIRLEYVMQTFLTTSNLRQEMALKYLRDGVDDLKETLQRNQMFDGQFRVYRWGELEVMNPRESPFESHLSDIEIYDAKIEGNVKIVKVYRNQDAFMHATNLLKLVREHPRLPFSQLEGYTDDSFSPFLVLKGGLTNMFEYLMELEALDYFIERLGFMIDMKRAMLFLASHGFRWKGWVEKLMITESGRLAMGYADDIVQRLDTDSDGGNSRILISWPKPGVAEGLHTLVERHDQVLLPIHSEFQGIRIHQDLNSMSILCGQYIDELSCGITSFVTATNFSPPPLGSIGYFKPGENGMEFEAILSSYMGKVNVRSTSKIRPRLGKDTEEDNGEPDYQDVRNWRNFEGEEISMPLLLSSEISSIINYRTTYAQLQGHSCVVEHLVRNGHQLSAFYDVDLESLVVVSAIIERASAAFSGFSQDSYTSERRTMTPVFFHPRPPDPHGYSQKPWGFLSSRDKIERADVWAEYEASPGQDQDEKRNTYCHKLGNIVACTEQSYELHCFQFSSTEATAIRHLYTKFPS